MENPQWHVPEKLYYDTNDYWVRISEDEAIIGLTDFGQYNTGDILYLELPSKGTVLARGEKIGSIESGKWVGKLSAPLTGKVTDINQDVETRPHLIKEDAYGAGWLYRMHIEKIDEITDLMDTATYVRWIDEQIEKEKENSAI